MSAILNALGAGYSASHILRYLSQQNPQLGQKISSALNAGHTVDHVLNYISRFQKNIGKLVPDQKEQNRPANLYKTAQSSVHPSLSGMAQAGGAALALGAGAYALSRAIPTQVQSLIGQGIGTMPGAPNQPIPNSPQGLISPQEGVAMQAGQGTQQPLTQTAQQAPISSNITQPKEAVQPEIKPIDVKQIFSKYPGFESKVNELMKSGNDVEAISTYFKKFNASQTNKLEKEAGKPIEKVIDDYIIQVQAQKPQSMEPEGQKLDASITTPQVDLKIGDKFTTRRGDTATLTQLNDKTFEYETDKGGVRSGPISALKGEVKEKATEFEPANIEKGSVAASPQGIGSVRELRGNKALVEIKGKLHKFDVEDLEQEPEEIKRSEIIIKPEQIPENLRSAALGFVSVPKSRRDIDIMYGPSGKFYRYYRKDGKPIPEEVIEKLQEGQTMPISSGDTYMGAFDSSVADSRGTVAYHDLKAKAQSKEAVETGSVKKGKHVKEEDDPDKEFWYEELESPFIHGFIDEFLKTLTMRSREYQKAKKRKV